MRRSTLYVLLETQESLYGQRLEQLWITLAIRDFRAISQIYEVGTHYEALEGSIKLPWYLPILLAFSYNPKLAL